MNLKFLLPLGVLLLSSFWSHPSHAQDLNNSAVFRMCASTESNLPEGVLYDSGGPNDPYSFNEDCSFQIHSICNTEIVLNIDAISLENCCDYLRIYDGTDSDSPLIYESASGAGIVIAESGNAFIQFDSDFSVQDDGFEISWQYENGANMDSINAGFTYSGGSLIFNFPIQFTDESEPLPYLWNWDFGDGTSSVIQNPIHSFQTSGAIDVRLISENCASSDTIVQTLQVQEPPVFVIDSQTIYAVLDCDMDTVVKRTIYNQGNGDLVYDFNVLNTPYEGESLIYFNNGNVFLDTTEHSFLFENDLYDDLEFEVTISGDYNTFDEYVQVYVEGEYLGELGGDVFNEFEYSQIFVIEKEWLAEFLTGSHLDIQIVNSSEVDPNQNGEDYHKVDIRSLGLGYVETPTGGIIAAGDSAIVSIPINAAGSFSGIDSLGIEVITNDLSSPIYIPIVVEIVDDPILDLSNDCLVFSEIIAFTSESLDLVLSNTSCSILYIDSINSTNSAFVPSVNSLVLYPGKQETISVSFLPQEEGNYNDELTFVGNFPSSTICLEGDALVPPVISVSDTAINVVLVGCQDSSFVSIDISNLSGSDLIIDYGLKEQLNPPLDSVRIKLNEEVESIRDLIPNLYPFSNGISGSAIYTSEMYSSYGNRMRFNSNSALNYSNNEVSYTNLGIDGAYFTNKYPGLFFFAADFKGFDDFEINGYIEEGSSALYNTYEFELEYIGKTYSCFVKQVYNGENPSVNHLIIIEKTPGVIHDYGTNPYYEQDGLTNIQDVDRLYYFLFSNEMGESYPSTVFEEVFETFVKLIGTNIDLQISPETTVLEAGSSENIDFLLTSENLNSGIYRDILFVSSNDPINPFIEVPIQMEVIGEPELALAVDCLEFPGISQFTYSTLELELTNNGCGDLVITDFNIPSEDFIAPLSGLTIAPNKSEKIYVTFSPDEVSDYSGYLILSGNFPTDSICLTGSSYAAPFILSDPQSIEVSLESCSDSDTVSLAVINTGGSLLELNFTELTNDYGFTSLDSVRTRFKTSFNTFTDQLPNNFEFLDGESGFYIIDGGNDMYNQGNMISFSSSQFLNYSNDQVVDTPIASYFTLKLPGVFMFAADINDTPNEVSDFSISGSLGWSTEGNVYASEAVMEHKGEIYKGFFKQVVQGARPSVNHLIIVKESAAVEHTFSYDFGTDDHTVSGLNDEKRIYYVLFAGEDGYLYSAGQLRKAMKKFLEIVERSEFFSYDTSDEQIQVGDTSYFDIIFNTNNNLNGVYDQYIEIQSNDPLNPSYQIPVSVSVSDEICADFYIHKTAPCNGEVEFVAAITNNPTSYLWDFGDGITSTEENPIHTFTNPGNYAVELTMSNGTSSDVISKIVEIESVSGPIASCLVGSSGFSSSIDIESFSLHTINKVSQGSVNNYSDYTCDYSTELTIGVVYPFEVVADYFNSLDVAIWIDLNNNGEFESSELVYYGEEVDSPVAGELVIPQGSVTNMPLRCRVATGTYWNTILPCNYGVGGEFEDYTVVIVGNSSAPDVSFVPTILDDCQGAVQFIDESVNFPTSWFWDFGDGNNSSSQSPFHIYSQAGIYEVTLTASNEFGSNTTSYTVTVNALNPTIETSGSISVDSEILFDANIVGGIYWLWDFGDGTTSSDPTPMHVYEAEGTYTVSVEVSNGVGCQNYDEKIINVFATDVKEVAEESKVIMFPNPTTGIFYLENRANTALNQIQVFNALGQLIKIKDNSLNKDAVLQLDLSTQPAGTYFVELQFEDKIAEVQMIIKT